MDKIDYARLEWDVADALEQWEYLSQIPRFQKDWALNAQDIAWITLLAAWEVFGYIAQGKTNKRRKGQLRKLASDSALRLRQIAHSWSLIRSQDNQKDITLAAIALSFLKDALEEWK